MSAQVFSALRRLVRRIGIDRACQILADESGKPMNEQVLRNQMTGTSERHKFSLASAVALTCESGHMDIVNAMCLEVGAPLPTSTVEPVEGSFMRAMSAISTHKAKWLDEVTSALDDDKVTENELHDCEAALADLLQAVQGAHAKLRAKHVTDKARAQSLTR